MELLERQNADLQQQIRALREELEAARRSAVEPSTSAVRFEALQEQVQIQADRIAEQDQIKAQGTHRAPLRLTGMVLFNAFVNSRNGGQMFDYTPAAVRVADKRRSGATLAQSVFGLEFQAPEAVLGGRVKGSFLLDLSAADGTGTPTSTQVRLRTATVEAQWKSRSIMVGQEKPIFSPREPNSLARLTQSPLVAAGNLWLWRPQARFEQRIKLGPAQDLRAQIGISQTREDLGVIPAQFMPTLENKRPALEGNFRFTHHVDDFRRIEFATGFHRSTTHVAGISIPSSVLSLDWFWNPVRKIEFTGTAFTGKNLAKFGGLDSIPPYVISTPRTGQNQATPIGGRGGWAQLTWLATSRLSFNLFSGQHHADHRELLASTIRHKNVVYGANFFYRLAPNVITGIEASQARSWYVNGQRALNNHYDLYVAYLF